MNVDILLFGQLAEIIGTKSIRLTEITGTKQLADQVHKTYPALSRHLYRIAINHILVSGDIDFEEDCTVALLPPFSGG